MSIEPDEVVSFWREAGPSRWYRKDEVVDEEIRRRVEAAHHAAARGEHDDWLETAGGALALLILLDQFPRNLFRGTAHAFATDSLARKVARAAVERGYDRSADPALREFFYMPFEHSEDLGDQDRALALFVAFGKETDDPDVAKWAVIHRAIIERFGRFPHRNTCLGRDATPEEQAFLEGGGFAG